MKLSTAASALVASPSHHGNESLMAPDRTADAGRAQEAVWPEVDPEVGGRRNDAWSSPRPAKAADTSRHSYEGSQGARPCGDDADSEERLAAPEGRANLCPHIQSRFRGCPRSPHLPHPRPLEASTTSAPDSIVPRLIRPGAVPAVLNGRPASARAKGCPNVRFCRESLGCRCSGGGWCWRTAGVIRPRQRMCESCCL